MTLAAATDAQSERDLDDSEYGNGTPRQKRGLISPTLDGCRSRFDERRVSLHDLEVANGPRLGHHDFEDHPSFSSSSPSRFWVFGPPVVGALDGRGGFFGKIDGTRRRRRGRCDGGRPGPAEDAARSRIPACAAADSFRRSNERGFVGDVI